MPDPSELFALCVWREASGEGSEGMRAVAWVIFNRCMQWKKNLTEVILGKNQFTSMTVDQHPRTPGADDPQMAEARSMTLAIMNGQDKADPTRGACYYWNPATADSAWFTHNIADSPQHPKTVVIGRHEFFR